MNSSGLGNGHRPHGHSDSEKPSSSRSEIVKEKQRDRDVAVSHQMAHTQTTALPSDSSPEVNAPTPPPLPSLNYHVMASRTRVMRIAIFFALYFVEAGILPLILFFSLKWGAHVSTTINLAIITSLVGTYTSFKFSMRHFALWFAKDSHENRPLGAGRWGVDCCQIWVSIAMTFFFIPLIIGSSITPASPKTVSLALPLFMLALCFPLAATGLFPHYFKMPFRVSSFPAYTPLPPLTFTMVEDVVAVDGGGQLAFRTAFAKRYDASSVFRKLLRDMALFWGITGTVLAWGFIVIAWTTAVDIGYGICYGVPWGWGAVCAAVSVWWVEREIHRERREWGMESVAEKREHPDQMRAETILEPVMRQMSESERHI